MNRYLSSENLHFLGLLLLAFLCLNLPARPRQALVTFLNGTLTYPLQVAVNKAVYYRMLEDRGEAQHRKLVEQSLEVSRLRGLEWENRRLRELLDFVQRGGGLILPALVLDRRSAEHTLLIDKGRLDGLRADLPVVTPQGLAGKTVMVGPRTAQVELHTHPEFRASALVPRVNELGLAAPGPGGGLELRGLSIRTGVRPGDEVVTSGLGGVFPRGIPLGVVSRVGEGELALLRRAVLAPSVDPGTLLEVAIIILSQEGPDWNDPRDDLSEIWEQDRGRRADDH